MGGLLVVVGQKGFLSQISSGQSILLAPLQHLAGVLDTMGSPANWQTAKLPFRVPTAQQRAPSSNGYGKEHGQTEQRQRRETKKHPTNYLVSLEARCRSGDISNFIWNYQKIANIGRGGVGGGRALTRVDRRSRGSHRGGGGRAVRVPGAGVGGAGGPVSPPAALGHGVWEERVALGLAVGAQSIQGVHGTATPTVVKRVWESAWAGWKWMWKRRRRRR